MFIKPQATGQADGQVVANSLPWTSEAMLLHVLKVGPRTLHCTVQFAPLFDEFRTNGD